jgi:hypothetical protein
MRNPEQLWTELNYETRFVNMCANEGWLCEKFISPGKRGVPDRLVTAANGYICFVELKKPGGRLHPLQKLDHQRRRDRGAHVYVVNNLYEAREVVQKIKQEAIRNGN